MPTHTEKRIMPYTAKQMYDLVADVETYPDFLPWCAATRIRKVTKDSHKTIIEADLIIAFKVFRERFGSRVTLKDEKFSVDVEYLDGPFKHLNNHWIFRDVDGGCEADFFVDFEFKSRVLQALIGVVFNEAMLRIVKAFEMRADDLYK
ncbi:type II toxin-antitoxin system RatA family toxin [Amylibacter sp.]|nr:type II toxin-antitoxin system RatA family toxin [Amylibacter sp.]